MKGYTKLFRTKYNNKIFDIYYDKNRKKHFFEIRCENGVEKMYRPSLKDYSYLNGIYNDKPEMLHPKKDTQQKRLATVGTVALMILNYFTLYNSTDKILGHYEAHQIVAKGYYEDSSDLIIKDFMSSNVTFDDVRNTLKQNTGIQDEYRKYINLLIDRLEERLPNVDLKKFNYSLKKLSFNVISKDEWTSSSGAYYDIVKNEIVIKNDANIYILFHELCHLLRNIMIKDGNKILFYDAFFVGDYYGNSFSEDFNTILADYLLVDDWQNYFDADVRRYGSYIETSSTQYQILKLLNGKNSLYDYLNGNIYDFKPKLEELGLSDIIDIMDIYVNSLGDITLVDNQEYSRLKQKILELRIKDELNKGKSDIELYNFVYQVQLYEATIEYNTSHIKSDDIYIRTKELFEENMYICTNILSDRNNSNWNIRINNKAQINDDKFINNKINVYSGNKLLFTKTVNQNEGLNIFMTQDDEICYRMGIYNHELNQYNVSGGEVLNVDVYNVYDILTGEKVENVMAGSDIIPILSNYTELPFQFYDIDVNIDMLEKEEFTEYLDLIFKPYMVSETRNKRKVYK